MDIISYITGLVRLKGSTDGTKIGNVNDSLKVFTTLDGAVSTAPLDFFLGVQREVYTGYRPLGVFGVNPALDNTNSELLWAKSAAYTFPTSASTLSITSTSADDASAGTGLRTLKLRGLDSSYNEIEETITMNGTTAVTTTNSYFRLNEAVGVTGGSGLKNAGVIEIKHGSLTLGYIPAGITRTQLGLFTVPANHTLYLYEWAIQISNGKASVSSLVEIDHVNKVEITRETVEHSESVHVPVTPLLKITEKNSITLMAKASTGSHRASGYIHGVLVDEGTATL